MTKPGYHQRPYKSERPGPRYPQMGVATAAGSISKPNDAGAIT